MSRSMQVRELGDQFPDLSFATIGGGRLRLSDFRGKRLLIFSWSSW